MKFRFNRNEAYHHVRLIKLSRNGPLRNELVLVKAAQVFWTPKNSINLIKFRLNFKTKRGHSPPTRAALERQWTATIWTCSTAIETMSISFLDHMGHPSLNGSIKKFPKSNILEELKVKLDRFDLAP